MHELKKFFSTSEAAELLGISRVSIFRRIKAGEIPARKVGRNYIIATEDLFGAPLTDTSKKLIKEAVHKATNEYGEVFKLLSKE